MLGCHHTKQTITLLHALLSFRVSHIFRQISVIIVTHIFTCSLMCSFHPACNVVIVPRSQWGARSANHINMASTPTGVVIHHTDTPRCYNYNDCNYWMRAIQNYHMDHWGKCLETTRLEHGFSQKG